MTEIRKILFSMQDTAYKQFNSKLIPNVSPDTQIGVRLSDIRRLAKKLKGTPAAEVFMKELPHKYFEENNLHGCLIEEIKDFGSAVLHTEEFLPYIDNWATCDTLSPRAFKSNTAELLKKTDVWLKSKKTYTVRFGVSMLMKFFLDENFSVDILEKVAEIKSDEYYVNMMRAWFFATAAAKQRDAAMPYFTEKRLDVWTHNKAIQKCIESSRISREDKEFLRTLKIKA